MGILFFIKNEFSISYLFSKTAVLGISDVKKKLLNGENRLTQANTKSFSDIESAKDYLLE